MAEGSKRGELLREVWAVTSSKWATTTEIARELGLNPRPGTHDLRPIREALYALQLHGHIEQKVRHNGHRWRRADA